MNNLISQDQETNLIEVDNQGWADKYHALVRLYDNPDFKTVILDGYFVEQASNNVSMLAAPVTLATNGARSELIEMMISISRLQDYFVTIRNLGRPAEEDDEHDSVSE